MIALAQAKAGVEAESISYIETHGTATPLGDPIEVEALVRAFRAQTERVGFCALGSVKANVGHLTAAAGVAGLIKTALSLEQRTLPPTVHFERPNPQIPLAGSPFYVNQVLAAWPAGETPRRAGVSSFGVGGTNVHVVLEEPPALERAAQRAPSPHLLMLSARSEAALNQAADELANWLEDRPEMNLGDVAHTLRVGRRSFSRRACCVAETIGEAVAALRSREARSWLAAEAPTHAVRLAWLFPGQGAQYARMGAGLYRDEPVFRSTVDDCAARLAPWLDCDVRDVLYSTPADLAGAAERLQQTKYTQPALFVIEYALARLWLAWGLQPAALVGHSVGEFVAACLADVFSLDDGLRIVATRGRLMQQMAPGAMLSVRLPAEHVGPRLRGQLALAAINSPSLCVVAGPTLQVDELATQLTDEGIACKRLHTSHAFHSPLVDPVVDGFVQTMREVELHEPKTPIVSTATGTWLRATEAVDPLYWAKHLRRTVQFASAVSTLYEDARTVLLEVGPRATLTTLARQNATDGARATAVASLGDTAEGQTECRAVLQAAGKLWLAGVACDGKRMAAGQSWKRVPLPTYPFERKPYLVAPGAARLGNYSECVSGPSVDMPDQETVEPAGNVCKTIEQVEETMASVQSRPVDIDVVRSIRRLVGGGDGGCGSRDKFSGIGNGLVDVDPGGHRVAEAVWRGD